MMKTRPLTEAEKLLGEIAISPPRHRNKSAYKATVRWELVERIRKYFDDRNVDWRAAQDRMFELRDERLKEMIKERENKRS